MDDRLAILAHELRSSVAALVAVAEALAAERQTLQPEQARRLVELAVAAGRSIERLLTDQDVLSIAARPIAVEQLLDEVVRGRAGLDVDPGLVVVADAVRLRQAVENLLENALRHGSAVEVTARAIGDDIRIAIADDGPGVPPDLDVFASGVSGVGSTGYGLAVARAIAEGHGGRIELSSEPPAGATFTLVLPSGAD